MSNSVKILLFVTLLMLASCGTQANALDAPEGEVILTVTGALESPNVDDQCLFDAGLFDANAVEQTIDDPWMGDGLVYRGLTLEKIWDLCGGSSSATNLTLVAQDGMEVTVKAKDLKEWSIMLAYQVDGQDLIEDLGGPVKMVFPADARETYPDDVWMWWVVGAEIQ